MIEGNSIRLRAWRESDLPTVIALRNDIVLQAQLLARVRGSDEQQVRSWLLERSRDGSSLLFIIAEIAHDAPLGYLQFTDIDLVDRRAELGICLGHLAQGKGAGQEAIKLAMTALHETWDIRKLSLRVRADNLAAIHCYDRVGFKQCGLLREHSFIAGELRDVILMEAFLAKKH